MPTFPDSIPPASYGSNPNSTARILQNNFGDGYTQRVADGLNSINVSWNLSWDLLDTPIADTLEAFLVARAGWESFDWTPPRATISSKWICKQWSRKPTAAGYESFTATFDKVFDL